MEENILSVNATRRQSIGIHVIYCSFIIVISAAYLNATFVQLKSTIFQKECGEETCGDEPTAHRNVRLKHISHSETHFSILLVAFWWQITRARQRCSSTFISSCYRMSKSKCNANWFQEECDSRNGSIKTGPVWEILQRLFWNSYEYSPNCWDSFGYQLTVRN